MMPHSRLTSLLVPLLAIAITATPAAGQRPARSPSTAFHISLWSTVVPVGVLTLAAMAERNHGQVNRLFLHPLVIGTALILGPELGYIYGGDSEQGLRGARIRVGMLAGLLLFASPLRALDETGKLDNAEGNETDKTEFDEALFVGLAVAMAGSAALDIVKVDDRIRARNARLGDRVSVFPTWVPAQSRPGLGVRITF